MTEGQHEALIATTGSWASALVRAAFLFPSAWVLERVVHRLRDRSKGSPLLALPILVVAVYAFGTTELLEKFDYLPREHPLLKVVQIASGATMVAFIPLLLVWAVLAFRQRRR